MKSQLREQALKLRIEDELSFGEIKKRLGVPKSTLSYWLNDFPLSEAKILELRRRGWEKGEAARERFRSTMRAKREQRNLQVYREQQRKLAKLSRIAFYVAGLVLYLAEGDKKDHTRLALANTDPRIVKFFIRWMTKFLGIQAKQVKIQLHLYENMNIAAEIEYWQKSLRLGRSQFYRPSIRKLRKSSFSYRESYRHGTCAVYLLGVERKREVEMAIKAFFDKSEGIW